ncbi:MAG TPA: DUF4238 domain-containing protein [Pyrinomonadaceae bacterium]|jgi:hypothetical protein|nr:DUF4238 domain-containing protein [Pyrinomonadaceae bacterium]
MAGTRHHILPRFLLKGFASKVISKANKKDDVFVWVFRKEAKPFESNIVNVGVEKHFYGREGELNADDEMTSIESGFAISLDVLREQGDGYRIVDEKVIEFIVHLTARTKHLRDTIIDTGSFLFDSLFGYFTDYDNWRAYCVNYFERHPEVIKDELEKFLQNVPASAYKKAMMRQRVKKMPVERIVAFMDDEKSGWEFFFASLRLKVTEGLDNVAKQAHIKSLLKNLVSEPRVEHYKRLNWYLRKASVPLILGDVGCLFELEGKSRFTSLGGTEDEIKNVYLPISTDCMIVGTARQETPVIDFTAINEAVAKCSRDYFVCSTSSTETVRLSDLLGEESDMITREDMEKAITELIDEP